MNQINHQQSTTITTNNHHNHQQLGTTHHQQWGPMCNNNTGAQQMHNTAMGSQGNVNNNSITESMSLWVNKAQLTINNNK